MSDRDGGPAFPRPYSQHDDSVTKLDNFDQQEGMSLRDYFAAKALTLGGEFFHNLGNGCDTEETVAQAAYQIADAMLAARKEKP